MQMSVKQKYCFCGASIQLCVTELLFCFQSEPLDAQSMLFSSLPMKILILTIYYLLRPIP